MLSRILNKITGDVNQKEINKLLPTIGEINHIYAQYDEFSDEQIKAKTKEFRERLEKGETLDDILPEAFATVKQACKRMMGQEIEIKGEKSTWNMIPYDVQLIGGMILHQGKIAEMRTGEGKTLVAVLPVYLNALTGKGVHVVTVNDYLASRDADWMGHIYNRLGLSIGNVTKATPVHGRREEYGKDITYVENSELGFDYLRDNLTKTMKDRVLIRRPMNYAIVDEIDSILVDEARTPLIISEPREEPTEKYQHYMQIVKTLKPCTIKKKVSKGLLHELVNEKQEKQEEDGDYYIDEKTKTASLSGQGITKLENMIGVENLYKDIGYEEIHHIENALRAQAVYDKDKEYIVKNGEVLIVDEHTGRSMPGRRFSEGLHQAIEAKENVKIQRESKTIATITYQNFFKQYKKLAGMTGTALTESEEFEKIYELSVMEIPTNKPIIRVDNHDKVYFNQKAKWKFVSEYIDFAHHVGQPILIGTANIQTSEYVSSLLEKKGITHSVLNAKFHEQEANIVSNAGKYRSIVVATNMAGRGTDIKLEKDLNNKLAKNYATWIEKNSKETQTIKAIIYSESEFDLTIDALKKHFGINDEDIRNAEKSTVEIQENVQFKINFISPTKKDLTKKYAELIFKNTNGDTTETITKSFHYGLFILGTEKHESRRIDNQLRGRAGRQGDPGVSIFFVALDDLIMRKMGGERVQQMASVLLSKDDIESMELNQKQFTSSITRAQKQIEGRHFSTRKHLFDYDSVINTQRQRIYDQRDAIIESEETEQLQKEFIQKTHEDIKKQIHEVISKQIDGAKSMKQDKIDFLENTIKEFGLILDEKSAKKLDGKNWEELREILPKIILESLEKKFSFVDEVQLYHILKDVFLHHIDTLWIKHIDEMQYLRDKVGLMGYAQLDPLIVYKKEAFEKFQTLLYNLKLDSITYICNINFENIKKQQELQKELVQKKQQGDQSYLKMLEKIAGSGAVQEFLKQQKLTQESNFGTGKVFQEDEDGVEVFEVDDTTSSTVDDSQVKKKTRPNDPCPCGSGKKYKKCCGAK